MNGIKNLRKLLTNKTTCDILNIEIKEREMI